MKKMNFSNLKTRIEIGLIILCFLIASINSVSSLLSITDDTITDDTYGYGTIIEFINNSAYFTNMTIDNLTASVYNQGTPPDIPTGTIAWWLNSTDSNLSVVVDIGDTQYYVTSGSGASYVAGLGLNLTGVTFSFNGSAFGENLTWDGQYLNATDTDTTYSSGSGVNLTGTTFSFNGTYGNARYLQHVLFGSNGLIKRTGAGTYSIVTDNSANWETAYTERGSQIAGENLTWDGSSLNAKYNNITLIRNSNDRSYEPTAANLQAAVDDAGDDGWVCQPTSNISLTVPLTINYNNFDFYGYGDSSVLYLADAANCTMITITGKSNVHIHGIKLEGNSLGQDEWDIIAHGAWNWCNHGIHLVNCDNIKLSSLTINNTHSLGILAEKCRNVNIHDNLFTKNGWLHEQSGNGYQHYPGAGIYLYNTSNSVVTNNIVNNSYACGIISEGYLNCPIAFRSSNNAITGNHVSDTGYGYYFEDASFNTLTGNTAYNCTDDNCFGASAGIRVHADNNAIIVTGFSVEKCKYGIQTAGDNCSFSDMHINLTTSYGIYDDGNNCSFDRINFDCTALSGIYSQGRDNDITNCKFLNIGTTTSHHGVEITTDGNYFNIENNEFKHIAGVGIYTVGDHQHISGNTMKTLGSSGILTTGDYHRITDNDIHATAQHGIEVQGDNGGIISTNIVREPTADYKRGIRINGAINWTVSDNIVSGYRFGIEESGISDYNKLTFNDVSDFVTSITIAGSNSYAMWVNASTAMIGIQNSGGTTWK